jgi:ribosome modulation factor
MKHEEVEIGSRVKMTGFAGHQYRDCGTGIVLEEEMARSWCKEMVKTGRFLIKIDEGTYHNPCLTDGIGAFVPSEMELITSAKDLGNQQEHVVVAEGYKARKSGVDLTMNPYTPSSNDFKQWIYGWKLAQ